MEEDYKKEDFEIVGPDPQLDDIMLMAELYYRRYEDYKRKRVDIGRGGMATQYYAYSRDMEEKPIKKKSKRWNASYSYNNDIIRMEERIFSDSNSKGEGGFINLIERYGLSREEAIVLAILIWDRTNANYTRGSREFNQFELLEMIYLNLCETIRSIGLFDEEGTLRREGLIEEMEEKRPPFRNKPGICFTPTEKVLVAVMGDYGREMSVETGPGRRRYNGGPGGVRSLNITRPRVNLDDVVLPEETEDAVMEALAIVEQKELIYDEWGIDRVIEKGRGTILLFYGPPGTGKTMTAEALASYLNKEVCSVNIAQLENAFVGVTEKNIEEVFKRAKKDDLFLLFDECDSLISSRDNKTSISKYYNKVVNMLLREIEEFEGVLVMTTNRGDFLDDALERRVALRVMFNMPGYEERLRIWERFLSIENAVSEDVDVEKLAGEYELSGGEIKNAFIAGARVGARRVKEENGERLITMSDLLKGCKMAKEGAGVKVEKRLGF